MRQPSHSARCAATIASSLTSATRSTSACAIGNGIDRAAGRERAKQRRRGLWLDADHPRAAPVPGGDAGDQAATAHRDQHGVERTRLPLELAAERAGAEHGLGLVEGVDR
jgi:hypothetical protein